MTVLGYRYSQMLALVLCCLLVKDEDMDRDLPYFGIAEIYLATTVLMQSDDTNHSIRR